MSIKLFIIFILLFSVTVAESSIHLDHAAIAKIHLAEMSDEELDADWKLNEFFGTIVVINLPQATERLEHAKESLKAIGVDDFEILAATDGRRDVDESIWKKMNRNWKKLDLSTEAGQKLYDSQRQGEMGCYISHLRAIQNVQEKYTNALHELKQAEKTGDVEAISEAAARVKKYSSVLILEDDNAFGIVNEERSNATLTGVGRLFRYALSELPQDWKLFYLMVLAKHPSEKISEHIVKLTRGIELNAYAVHHTIYDILIQHLQKIYDPKVLQVNPVDDEIAEFHLFYPCYAVTPSIAYQREGLSFIHLTSKTKLRQSQGYKISLNSFDSNFSKK